MYEKIRNAVLSIVPLYPIQKVTLFGSRASGSNRPDSDVDLIIEFFSPVTLLTLSMIQLQLEEILELNVDIVHGPLRDSDLLEIENEVEIYAA